MSIFIFRRDLRLDDNIGLIEALKHSKRVLPIFILNPEQLDSNKNEYKSNNCVQFMIESLKDLDKSLKKYKSKLWYFYGENTKVIDDLLSNNHFDSIYVNMDYTPYSVNRDKMIKEICDKHHVNFVQMEDILLNPVGSIKTKTEKIYTKFTPYYNNAKKIKVLEPCKNNYKNYRKSSGKITSKHIFVKSLDSLYKNNKNIWVKGGRSEALKIINNVKTFKDYNKIRNIPSLNTTYLSAYNKFGCVSIREVYKKFKDELGMKNDLIKQLYWRDFYYNIVYEYPYVIGGSMKKKYDKIKWKGNKLLFDAWKKGETGYPIIDAAMKSMIETGFMHNRCRLIVADFLIKILHIDWREGEKFFAQNLVDYDPAQNNGNWQWVSGTGADSQPYFRIFNPWSQSEKYDKDAKYIKKWLPQLENVSAKHIHNWNKYGNSEIYPLPIIEYEKERKVSVEMYKKIY